MSRDGCQSLWPERWDESPEVLSVPALWILITIGSKKIIDPNVSSLDLWTPHTDTIRSELAIRIYSLFFNLIVTQISHAWALRGSRTSFHSAHYAADICFISEYLTAALAFILNLVWKHSPKPFLQLASFSLLCLWALNWAHQELFRRLWCSLAMTSVLLHLPQSCSDCLMWRSMFVVDKF